jgi:hypothetical protein
VEFRGTSLREMRAVREVDSRRLASKRCTMECARISTRPKFPT